MIHLMHAHWSKRTAFRYMFKESAALNTPQHWHTHLHHNSCGGYFCYIIRNLLFSDSEVDSWQMQPQPIHGAMLIWCAQSNLHDTSFLAVPDDVRKLNVPKLLQFEGRDRHVTLCWAVRSWNQSHNNKLDFLKHGSWTTNQPLLNLCIRDER